MGRSEDPLKSGVDDAAAVLSIIRASASRIAQHTTNPQILREVHDILQAAKRGENYLAILRRLEVIERRY